MFTKIGIEFGKIPSSKKVYFFAVTESKSSRLFYLRPVKKANFLLFSAVFLYNSQMILSFLYQKIAFPDNLNFIPWAAGSRT